MQADVNRIPFWWRNSNSSFEFNSVLFEIPKYWPTKILHKLNPLEIPLEFDARNKWAECPSISTIYDQGHCGSCWAFGGIGAMADRTCISSNGTFNRLLSAADLVGCCSICGFGYGKAALCYLSFNRFKR